MINRKSLECGRQLYFVEGMDGQPNPPVEYSAGPQLLEGNNEVLANLVGSTYPGGARAGETWHMPVFDLDTAPTHLVSSRSSGHHHLYLNTMMPWQSYKDLLIKFANLGLCDADWADACVRQGVGVLRRQPI